MYTETYVEMRKAVRDANRNRDKQADDSGVNNQTFTSARNLLSVLRLATALARLRLADRVGKDDVKEAHRLIERSKQSVNHKPDEHAPSRLTNRRNKLYAIVQRLAGTEREVKVSDVLENCVAKGFTPDEVNDIVEEYERLNIWHVNMDRKKITFVM